MNLTFSMLISGLKVQGDSRFFNLSRSHGGKCPTLKKRGLTILLPSLVGATVFLLCLLLVGEMECLPPSPLYLPYCICREHGVWGAIPCPYLQEGTWNGTSHSMFPTIYEGGVEWGRATPHHTGIHTEHSRTEMCLQLRMRTIT